jgi:PEP-CTERM motif-containing protein
VQKMSRRCSFISLSLTALLSGLPAFGGSVFVSGHDPDFHAIAGNTAGAQHMIQVTLGYARDGNTAPILLIKSNTDNISLGDHLDSEIGLNNSGYTAASTPGNHYVKVSAAEFALVNLALYSAIFVPSDHGGTLTNSDLAALNARSADILAYLNAGGGLVAFAEDGIRSGGSSAQNFGFLPFLVSAAAVGQGESSFTLTPEGIALGLTLNDINGNFSHNVFTSTGGMNVVDRDGAGRIVSLDFRGQFGEGGVVPEPSTLALFGIGIGGILLGLRRNNHRRV